MTRSELADALTAKTGQQWSVKMVEKLETARKVATPEVLRAVKEIQGLPLDFYFYGPAGWTMSEREESGRSLDLDADLGVAAAAAA